MATYDATQSAGSMQPNGSVTTTGRLPVTEPISPCSRTTQ